MADERLQKVLARAGVASRRAAEALITARRVRVDGRIVSELGTRVPTRARIEVDGRVVVAEPLVYVVLHKPRGVVCTLRDPEGRPTVAEYLKDVGARVVPVGRLDFHTSGALICTNDGELASRLMHPRHHAEKEYVAKVSGVVDERTLERLRERIVIDGRATQPAEVKLLRVEDGKSWLGVKLGEGRNRQVRRLGEHAGVPVMRLVRVAHAGITAEDLKPGEWRRLTLDELRSLKKEYGVPRRIHAQDPRLEQSRGGRVTLRQPRAEARRPREQPHFHAAERVGEERRMGRPGHGRPDSGARHERRGPERGHDERRGREERRRPAPDAGRNERRARAPERGRDERRPPAPERGRDERRPHPPERGRDERRAHAPERGRDGRRPRPPEHGRDERQAHDERRSRHGSNAPGGPRARGHGRPRG